MKKMKFVVLILSFMLVMPQSMSAQQGGGCVQPSYQEIDRLLTTEALNQNVPAEVVKAIAFVEAGGWDHCVGGEVHISDDGGIGIMQVTDPENEYKLDTNRLKSDISYNISSGVMILNDKFNRFSGKVIPKLNDGNPNVLENWYFAVMAYNGLVQKNSPLFNDSGLRNKASYQDVVFSWIEENNGGLSLNLDLSEVKREDLIYRSDGTLGFREMSYTLSGPLQVTRQNYQINDLVVTAPLTNYRTSPIGTAERIARLPKQVVSIHSSVVYDQTPDDKARNYNHFVWYPVETMVGKQLESGYIASVNLMPFGKRISGATRYETAVEISREGWNTADTVVLTNGVNFPDALAGAPLAYKLNAPILLTGQKSLHAKTKERIQELGAKKVVILGGPEAVSANVVSSLQAMNIKDIKRVGGSNRYETAALIAKELGGSPGKAIVASGDNFPDALAVAPYAAKNGYPILLAKQKSTKLHEATSKAIKDLKITSSIVVGGSDIVSNEIYKLLPSAKRISGQDRYATAVAIIEELNMSTDKVYTATGRGFADALTGSVLAAKQNSSILLVGGYYESKETNNLIKNRGISTFHVLGGENVVSNELLNRLLVD